MFIDHLRTAARLPPPPQVRTLARTDEARGLLWLMEEEAVQPGGSEETMLERLFGYYGSAQGAHAGERWRRGPRRRPDLGAS